MPNHFLAVKHLEHCEKGELVRANFNGHGLWAIVVDTPAGTGFAAALVILSHPEGPWLLSAQDTAHLRESAQACLSYGKKFDVMPVYDSACTVIGAAGATNDIPGTLIFISPIKAQSTTERYLVVGNVEAHDPRRVVAPFRFLNLDNFKVSGGTTGNRADFREWAIWMTLPSQPCRPSQIFKHPFAEGGPDELKGCPPRRDRGDAN